MIPAVTISMGTPPTTWAEVLPWFGAIFTPQLIIGDCLSAAICALWNIILEHNKEAL